MSQLVITMPADSADWGPVFPAGAKGCMQTCRVVQAGQKVCEITIVWPEPQPSLQVQSLVEGRHAGDRD